MSWLRKEDIPEELKDIGLTPAEIRARVLKAKELEDKQKEFETKLTESQTALEASSNQLSEMRTRLQSLEANGRRNNEEKPLPTFLDDDGGEAAFNARFQRNAAPLALVALNAAKNSARMEARAMLSGEVIETPTGVISLQRLWDKWQDKILKQSESVDITALGSSQTWLNIFNFIKGNNLKDILSKTSDFVEPVHSNVDRRVGDPPLADKLDDQLAAVVAKQSRYSHANKDGKKGVTPESVLETRKKMTVGAMDE